MKRRVGLLIALVMVAGLAVAVTLSPPDFVRSLLAQESPTDVAGEPLPPIEQPPLVRLAVVGDTGTGGDSQQNVAGRMADENDKRPYDALLILGDLIYEDGDAALVDSRITEPYQPLLEDGAELVPVLGNHDYESGEQLEILAALGRQEPWYLETFGPLRVIVLDSNQVENPAQTEWLSSVLAEPQPAGTWTLAAMHHPAYSAGYHGSSLDVRDAWSGMFAAADVPLVLAGHDHDYQRSEPQDGVTYVVSGGGAKLRDTGTDDFTAVSTSVLHFLDVLVYDDRLVVRAVDQSGRLVDLFTIES